MNNQDLDLVESFSGIRGVYGQSINEDFAYKYATVYCFLFCDKNSVLVVGGDSRISTPSLKKSMIKGFCDFGVKKIIDVGLLPVQVCELAVLNYKATGGVYITASHNEPEYNGWKFLKNDGSILYAEQADKLIKEVKNYKGNCATKKPNRKTIITNKNKEAVDNYISFVIKKLGKKTVQGIKNSDFKILADPNGGSSIFVLEKLFISLGIRAEIINNKVGKFVRKIEPNSESLAYLSEKMDNSFAFGCGLDCDSDRVEFVLPTGQMVSGQYVLALACDAILSGTKNQVVLVNDATSYLVRDVIKKYMATTKEVEVGETNVVFEMEKQKSIIGGEGSNGGVITMPIKCRDGIMTTVLILKLISERKQNLADILSSYPKYYSQRADKKCFPGQANKIKQKIESFFRRKNLKIKKTGGITGGLKILFDKNCYLWFRSSKTELGKFRIIADGDDLEKVKNILNEGIKIFEKFI